MEHDSIFVERGLHFFRSLRTYVRSSNCCSPSGPTASKMADVAGGNKSLPVPLDIIGSLLTASNLLSQYSDLSLSLRRRPGYELHECVCSAKGEWVAEAFCVSGNVQRRHEGRGAGAAPGPQEARDAFLRVQPPREILLP